MARRQGLPEGVTERHQNACKSKTGGRCNCTRTYKASVYNPNKVMQSGKVGGYEYSPSTIDVAEAVKWRTQALRELQGGTRAASDGPLMREAWAQFHEGAKSGAISNRNGERYKTQALGRYEQAWRLRLEPEFGSKRLGKIRRADVQAFADKMAAEGASKSTVNNTLDPLRVIYRRAVRRNLVALNPTVDIELPAGSDDEMRFASREEAAELIAALPEDEQALWATAFYAGLRRGELQAIRWSYVDLDAGVLTVLKAWSAEGGEGAPKSAAGRRRVPIVPVLGQYLKTHQERTRRGGDDLVFGRTAADPFVPSTVRTRALKAWAAADASKAKQLKRELTVAERLEPITLHQCRHTAASFLIASGANAKALSVVMGHSSIEVTFNRYGHLMPGGEQEVGRMLGEWLSRRSGVEVSDTDSSGEQRSTAGRAAA